MLQGNLTDTTLDTFKSNLLNLARQHFFETLKSQLLEASSLKDIVKKYEDKQNLTKFEEVYIHEYTLRSLNGFLREFQKEIREKLELEREAERKIKQEKARQEAIEKQKLLESDPVYIAEQKRNALLWKYGIYASPVPKKVTTLLNKLENETRLSHDEAVWFNTTGKNFYKDKVRHKFHRIEANFYLNEYAKNTKNIWNAINASSQLRKCKASLEAEGFLENISTNGIKDKKLLSAYFTTLGGVKRDLRKFTVAFDHAFKAHNLTPDNYRPCTLLGAIYMETHQYALGHEWYEKAIERGAISQSINADLKSIISKVDKAERNAMIEHLVKLDRQQYSWLNSLKVTLVKKPASKQNQTKQPLKTQKKPTQQQPVKAQKKPNQQQPVNNDQNIETEYPKKSLKALLRQGAKAHNLEKPVKIHK